MTSENSIVEQLRLQEGKLFQNERLMALYLDIKAVIVDKLIQQLRQNASLQDLLAYEDLLAEENLKNLEFLAPDGSKEYHLSSLHESVKTIALLLWPNQMMLVARPKLSTLLHGMMKRMCLLDPVKTGVFLDYDPIKQDFLVREQFRRTLVNDCLTIFDAPIEDLPVSNASVLKRPSGGHSVLGRDDDAESSVVQGPQGDEPLVKQSLKSEPSLASQSVRDSASEAPRQTVLAPREPETQRPTTSSVVSKRSHKQPDDDTRSVLTKSICSRKPKDFDEDAKSSASGSTAFTSTSIMRKPFNVRTVKIEEETL